MNSQRPLFRSLRFRLLAPMIVAAVLAAIAVAFGSYWLGNRWADQELQERFTSIERAVTASSFPLTSSVLDLLAGLTRTQLVGRDSAGNITYSTIDLDERTRGEFRSFTFSMRHRSQRSDRVAEVEVLFENRQIDAIRRRAAILPLVTGLSTIVALGSLTLVLSSRLVGRIGKLQRRVELVAGGDFESTVSDAVEDEIGRLGGAVDSMARQLQQLWAQINRQQSEKLLHQIAGGMAHQLRNSLTGARMAVELHAQQCSSAEDEGIGVAISQIEASEQYVRRLLLVASGRQDEDHAARVRQCFDDVRDSLSPIAKHLRIQIQWRIDESIADQRVCDGPSWIAAANNLIHNAMQAGETVEVALKMVDDYRLRLTVSDNGAGIADAVAAELFEPFVTSKPEGMGLGLSVVRRAADRLGGNVSWRRENDQTVFELEVESV